MLHFVFGAVLFFTKKTARRATWVDADHQTAILSALSLSYPYMSS